MPPRRRGRGERQSGTESPAEVGIWLEKIVFSVGTDVRALNAGDPLNEKK